MKKYAIYNLTNGEIIRIVSTIPEWIENNVLDGEGYLEVENPKDNHFILNNKMTPNNQFDVVINGNIISNIPQGTTAYVNGSSYLIEDGELEVGSNLPTTFKIRLSKPTYTDREFELHAY